MIHEIGSGCRSPCCIIIIVIIIYGKHTAVAFKPRQGRSGQVWQQQHKGTLSDGLDWPSACPTHHKLTRARVCVVSSDCNLGLLLACFACLLACLCFGPTDRLPAWSSSFPPNSLACACRLGAAEHSVFYLQRRIYFHLHTGHLMWLSIR